MTPIEFEAAYIACQQQAALFNAQRQAEQAAAAIYAATTPQSPVEAHGERAS